MSRKVTVVVAIALLLIVSLIPQGVFAQSATNQTWSTSITYYTPDATGGTLQIRYYPEGSATSIDADPITMSGHKAGSLFIGNVTGMTATFKGAAVLEADVPIVATGVNIAQTGPDTNYARPLYTGFDSSQASDEFFIPTILYQKFGYTSLVSVQNVGSAVATGNLKVYALGSTTAAATIPLSIQPQSAQLIAAADMGISTDFSGSGVVEMNGGAQVVAAVQETADSGRAAKAFEGLPGDAGATEIYMASMMCNAYGSQAQTSYYAIQNVGGSAATVDIEFYDKTGANLYTATGINVPVGGKVSENPCKYTGETGGDDLEGAVGSAVIKSTNSVPLIAMGKVKGAQLTETAFVGASAGSTKLAAPYIRWVTSPSAGERSYVAVMNVGAADATDVKVHYYDTSGFRQTHVLASGGSPLGQFIKANTNWETASGSNTNFGVSPYGGAIEVESDQPVIVVVRVQKSITGATLAEDYNGVSVP